MLFSNDGPHLLDARSDLPISRPWKDGYNTPAPRGDRIHKSPTRIRIDQFSSRGRWHAPTLHELAGQLRNSWLPVCETRYLRCYCRGFCKCAPGINAKGRVLEQADDFFDGSPSCRLLA